MGSEGEMLPDGLDDNILSEILLRLPPQPSSLPRASAVCKRWHNLACNPGFCHRFRRHHRHNAPLLGFFYRGRFGPTPSAPNRVPSRRFSLLDDDPDRYVGCASRHGLVFTFEKDDKDSEDYRNILVWDPVTGDQYRIGIPPGFEWDAEGMVLRDAGDVHFRVVLVASDRQAGRALALVYSSETNLWGDLISAPSPAELAVSDYPAVLVGDSLYWQLSIGDSGGILEFNLERQSLQVIQPPLPVDSFSVIWEDDGRSFFLFSFSVIREDDGGLGFLSVSGFTAQIWKRKTDASWVLGRTIELDKLLSLDPDKHKHISLERYVEEENILFIRTAISYFVVHLPSFQSKFFDHPGTSYTDYFHPFESVFTP